MWGSEFTSKDAALQAGMIVVLKPLFAAALVVRRKYLVIVPRLLLAAQLAVRRTYLTVVLRPVLRPLPPASRRRRIRRRRLGR